eukprot:1705245-Alexandrium_andersonii.AAC.1
MPTQPDGSPSPIEVSSGTSPAIAASPLLGPPDISPTQPFSPDRGPLAQGRERALGEGRAASLPPLAALRASFAIA